MPSARPAAVFRIVMPVCGIKGPAVDREGPSHFFKTDFLKNPLLDTAVGFSHLI